MLAERNAEQRLVTARHVLTHINTMIENPGGDSWPDRLNLTKDPDAYPELSFFKTTGQVIKAQEALVTRTKPAVERRITALEHTLIEEPMSVIRASVERRRQGLPGLSEEILQKAEEILRRLRSTTEPAQPIKPEAPVVTPPVVNIPVPVRPEPDGESVNGVKADEVFTPPAGPKPSVPGSASFVDAPQKADIVVPSPAEFDPGKLKLAPKEAKILQEIQSHPGGIGRLELARLVWPGRPDQTALSGVTFQLTNLRKKMREAGFSIADISTADDSSAVYNIVTVDQEAVLTKRSYGLRFTRGGKIKEQAGSENKGALQADKTPAVDSLTNNSPSLPSLPLSVEAGEKK